MCRWVHMIVLMFVNLLEFLYFIKKAVYRDDALAVFKNMRGPQAEKIKKDFQNVFRKKI